MNVIAGLFLIGFVYIIVTFFVFSCLPQYPPEDRTGLRCEHKEWNWWQPILYDKAGRLIKDLRQQMYVIFWPLALFICYRHDLRAQRYHREMVKRLRRKEELLKERERLLQKGSYR